MAVPTVADVRTAIERQDWSGAPELADAATPTDPGEAAELADLRAEALWWLGRVDECIDARERAYRGYLELGRTREAGRCAVWLWEHHAISARRAIAGAWLRRGRHPPDREPPARRDRPLPPPGA